MSTTGQSIPQKRQGTLLDAVLEYAAAGWPVFPLDGKDPIGAITPNGFKNATTNPETIRRWWNVAGRNVAMALPAGYIVVDVEAEGIADFAAAGFSLDRCPRVRTGGGGVHLYYKLNGKDAPVQRHFMPHAEVKVGGKCYLAMPPSIHPITGMAYEWEIALLGTEVPEIPDDLYEYIVTHGPDGGPLGDRKAAPPVSDVIPDGQRNATLASLAGTMRARGLGEAEIAGALLAVNRNRCTPPLPEPEVLAIARSISGYEPNAWQYHLTDLGNGRRLVDRHGNDLRYVYVSNHKLGTWWVWDGEAWTPDSGSVMRMAKDTVIAMYAEAAAISDDKARAALVDHARASESDHRLAAMVSSASTEPEVAAKVETFDADPWLLNCTNGTLDLRTGLMKPRDRLDFITKTVPVAYDPSAECELWLAFLDRIMDGDQDNIRFLKRLVGSSLTGVIRENALFILWGSGANGKSTFLETWRRLLGKYALQLDSATLMAKGDDRIPNDLARLPGVRLASIPETKKRGRLNEPLVKRLTGRDTITARFLHKEYFDFIPSARIVLCTNHKPDVQGTDYAMWRRIHLVPFGVTIPKEEQDTSLPDKLAAELPGILAWAVAGCVEWQADGIGTTEDVESATAAYRAEQDAVGRFLSECCAFDADAWAPSSELSAAWAGWAEENGGKNAPGVPELWDRLRERGCERDSVKVSGKTVRLWRGVRIGAVTPVTPVTPDSELSHTRTRTGGNPEIGVTPVTPVTADRRGLTIIVEEVLLEATSGSVASMEAKAIRARVDPQGGEF